MDLGNNEDILLKMLQYASYGLVAVFLYFGKKTLNDVAKIKETKADKHEVSKLEERIEHRFDKQQDRTQEILDKVTEIWQHLAEK